MAQRDYSVKILTEKIAEKWGEKAAQCAILKITDHGYLDDSRYAQNLAEIYLFERNYSVRKTVYELILKGVDRETAKTAIENFSPDEEEIIKAVIQKKYYNKVSDKDSRRRTFAALARLGFNSSDINRALNSFADTEDY